ncbi:30S ribosomal protein S9 [Candidatus Peregrinibacteria bacterium]|nr:MAG: 30S ribosomal protein S9 [Candidatus Peregrinibacteria bacterium]
MTKKQESTEKAQFSGRYYYASGKRKTAIARVRMYQNGSGKIMVNGKPMEEYFFGTLIGSIKSPLKLVSMQKSFDISVMVTGGGVSAQSDAIRHGIAKGLTTFDPGFRPVLKKEGLLTRDSRVKERKKFGLHGARRAPQFSKR